ncbi:MAG TPA: 23S rRNA (guanosine(2251)-2'-O)-methyltransferase RlmB, partial [Acidimicrobiales bacterium]|nr:23S rRNA (guanosine(2251)-2'-O)-methyltransferase RlmB [Acidimicrobiales bacterium]
MSRGLGGEQVEGRQAVRELLRAGKRRVDELWLAEGRDDAAILAEITDLAREARVRVQTVPRGRLEAAALSEAPQGVLAKAAPVQEVPLSKLCGGRPFLVAVDGVTDPGNLGAILRSAEVAGATGVVLPRHRAVHITPTVAKAAAGAIEYLPMCLVGGLPTALRRLEELGVWVVGLDADAERPLQDLPVHDEAVCLVFGAEGRGLSRLVRERCGALASIPLAGQLNSLNVGAAAAVAC